MELKEYLNELKSRVKKLDSKAKNPFLEYDYSYNPFKSALKQTYVWIEKESEKEC